jgi:hypothetical protein
MEVRRIVPEILVRLQTFVVDKLPDDGTLVMKHIKIGT